MLLVSPVKEILITAVCDVRIYLKENLKLTLHPRKIYLQSYTKGVDFLGVSIRVGRMYPRHRLKGNIYRLITFWNNAVIDSGGVLDDSQVSRFQASINSYLGTIAPYHTRKLRIKILNTINPLLLKHINFCSPYRRVHVNGVS